MQSNDIYRDYGPVGADLISSFEKKQKINLPHSYCDLLCRHDAARLKRNNFNFKNIFSESYSWPYKMEKSIDCREISFYGFKVEIPEYLHIENLSFDVYGHDKVVAFGFTANGDYICFDYRHDPSTNEPKVVVMFHDAYDDNQKMLICPVANTFLEFLDMLYELED